MSSLGALEANPRATIEVRGERVPVIARRAHGEEAEALWGRWAELQPSAPAFGTWPTGRSRCSC